MTIFLCILALLSLLGFGGMPIKGPTPSWVVVTLQALDVLMVLGLAALALWSHLS